VIRSVLLRWTVATSMLGAAVLAGCGSTRSTSSTTPTVVSSTSLPNVLPDNLRLTVFDRLPTNFIEEPEGSDSDGPLDLTETAQAVDDQEVAEQQRILEQYGFTSGYQRTWLVKGTGDVLIIRVQDMGSTSEALAYLNLLTFFVPTSAQLIKFPTPGLADASGFTRYFTGSTGTQVAQDVSLARGRLFYHLIFTGPKGSISTANVLGIARAQSTEAASLGYT
jgi:hypothetical protein